MTCGFVPTRTGKIMPRFEVTISVVYAFNAKDAAEAKYLVESGETPRNAEIIAEFVSNVDAVLEIV